MTRGRSREERIKACAAIVDPHARQCWHLRRINQLLNKLAQRVSEVNTLDAKLRVAQEKIAAQKITLARMNIQAEARNRKIKQLDFLFDMATALGLEVSQEMERLEKKVDDTDHTPAPQFDDGAVSP